MLRKALCQGNTVFSVGSGPGTFLAQQVISGLLLMLASALLVSCAQHGCVSSGLLPATKQSPQAKHEDWPWCAIPRTPPASPEIVPAGTQAGKLRSTHPLQTPRAAARSASSPTRTSKGPMAWLAPLVPAPQQPLSK